MQFRHIISTQQFLDVNILGKIFELAKSMQKLDSENKLPESLKNKILASVFYEPSTRTRFSFESAMQKLGGNIISTESASHFSSVIKGESLSDTIRIVSGYSDVIVLRHPQKGSAKSASEVSLVPVINAGDGDGEHPTQSLLDLYTIHTELGNINNLTIALIGDLLYGRTIHSLIYLLCLYKPEKIYLISPHQLKLPEKYKEHLIKERICFEERTGMEEILPELDLLYVTRIQKERFNSQQDYEPLKDSYIIDKKVLALLKKNTIIMHPLPRVNEISSEVDSDPRAAYFRQARNGLYVRMAILQMLLK